MSELLRRLAYYFRRRHFERDLDEEMRHHMSLSGAARFGNMTRWKEESRAMWSWRFFEQLGQDLRYALRTMKNNRAFTALAVLSLALGIGANTAIFSFMDAILLRSLPVREPESLVTLNVHAQVRGTGGNKTLGVMHTGMITSGSTYTDPKTGFTGGAFPFPAFELFRRSDSIFTSVFGYYAARNLNLLIGGQAALVNGEYVSGEFFPGLGVPPAAGRLIAPEDDHAGAQAVAVLNFGFAERRFGNAAGALGQAVLVDNVPFTVIGVAPPDFFGVDPAAPPDIYFPLHANLLIEPSVGITGTPERYLDPNFYWIEVMARLRPGMRIPQAQAALAPIFHEWVAGTASNDFERAGLPVLVVNDGRIGLDTLRRQYSKPLYVLITLVGLILAIASANVANLLLARAAARRREMAMRLSMGAGRWRVVRQLLTESVLLACLGGAFGIGLALWGIRFLTLLLANGRENFTLRADLNWRVLAVTACLSFLTGVLFGLAPAIQATRVDLLPALKESSTTEYKSRWSGLFGLRRVLVASQIAISLLILVAAGLFLRTLSNLQSVALGFNRENLLLFELNARQAGHRDPEIGRFYSDLLKRFRDIPGIVSASASGLPLVAGGTSTMPVGAGSQVFNGTYFLTVGPSFFTTMQIPILTGREINEHDQPGASQVAVVNELFAKQAFGNRNPLGQHIVLTPRGQNPREMQIIGVSGNAKYGLARRDFVPVVYLPFNQGSFPMTTQMDYVLRTAGDPLKYANTVREIVRQADSRVPISYLQTQKAQIDRTNVQEITFARLCTAFAILALAIASVGLYGTIVYNVTRRTNEIGIRMALGAQRRRVVQMVLLEVFGTVTAGLAIGLPIALASSKSIQSFLYGTKPNDPLAVTVAVLTLVVAAAAAAYAPAWRASRIDPMAALRHE
ncbi:MAG: ABC transporter permease [Bryobacterales bacterium]|nr:ABC transporter permease [Bryobacterales bacterium]